MKVKFNMVGGGFQHENCSSSLNKNNHVEWVRDGSAPVSIHIDNGLEIPCDPTKKNYGHIAESSSIIPQVIQNVLGNIDRYREKFLFIFTHDRRIIETDPLFFKFVNPPAVPWIQNRKIYSKSKLVSFIGSSKRMCAGHMFRQQMIGKYAGITDHYGRGFGSKELPHAIETDGGLESGKILGLKDYMFSFAMENDNYNDLFTEKVLDCFATGTIPIFWGMKNIGDYFDKDGIIFLEELDDIGSLTEELYYSKMESIKKNLKLAISVDTSEDYMYLNYMRGSGETL